MGTDPSYSNGIPGDKHTYKWNLEDTTIPLLQIVMPDAIQNLFHETILEPCG